MTSQISGKNFPLLKKKKEVTCPFHGLLLSNEPQLISAQPAKSCSFRQRQLLCWQAFLPLFPPLFCGHSGPSCLWQCPDSRSCHQLPPVCFTAPCSTLSIRILKGLHEGLCDIVRVFSPQAHRVYFSYQGLSSQDVSAEYETFHVQKFLFFPQALLTASVNKLMSLTPPASRCEYTEPRCCFESSGSPRLFPNSIIVTKHTLVNVLLFLF